MREVLIVRRPVVFRMLLIPDLHYRPTHYTGFVVYYLLKKGTTVTRLNKHPIQFLVGLLVFLVWLL